MTTQNTTTSVIVTLSDGNIVTHDNTYLKYSTPDRIGKSDKELRGDLVIKRVKDGQWSNVAAYACGEWKTAVTE